MARKNHESRANAARSMRRRRFINLWVPYFSSFNPSPRRRRCASHELYSHLPCNCFECSSAYRYLLWGSCNTTDLCFSAFWSLQKTREASCAKIGQRSRIRASYSISGGSRKEQAPDRTQRKVRRALSASEENSSYQRGGKSEDCPLRRLMRSGDVAFDRRQQNVFYSDPSSPTPTHKACRSSESESVL